MKVTKSVRKGDIIYQDEEGRFHREDGPAIEYPDGTKLWYQNGLLHRFDGPAVEYADGTKQWYQNGLIHREDGPAVEYNDGRKKWYLDGKAISSEEEYWTLVKRITLKRALGL